MVRIISLHFTFNIIIRITYNIRCINLHKSNLIFTPQEQCLIRKFTNYQTVVINIINASFKNTLKKKYLFLLKSSIKNFSLISNTSLKQSLLRIENFQSTSINQTLLPLFLTYFSSFLSNVVDDKIPGVNREMRHLFDRNR